MRAVRVAMISAVVTALMASPVWAVNDPLRPKQFGLDRIQADRAHTRSLGAGVIVAVIDTGVDMLHEDLRNQLLPGKDFVDNDDNPQDLNGHGTHVAGIVAAQSDNGVGVSSVAPAARILPLRVLDSTGTGVESDVAAAIRFAILRAIAMKSKLVINMSLTDLKVEGAVSSHDIRNAIRDAWSSGAVVVAAAGNEALPFSDYPAEGPNVISVGATDQSDHRASYSNKGANIMGPGDKIVSTFWDPQTPNDHQVYASGSGTSMAAPFVSGVAALLMASGMSNVQTVDRILRTADDLGPAGSDEEFGYGRLNAARALGLDGASLSVNSTSGLPPTQEGRFAPVGTAAGLASPIPIAAAPAAKKSRTVPEVLAVIALIAAVMMVRANPTTPESGVTGDVWEFDPFR